MSEDKTVCVTSFFKLHFFNPDKGFELLNGV